MKTILHRANSRGKADYGWLKSHHSFSFSSFYDPNKMNFGRLRVINDDQVAPSKGFSTHPHKNMEIVSIPLSGSLKHEDSEGNKTTISTGEVQLMSAGTGVFHSEYNASSNENVNFLQIWILPEKKDIPPRYDQEKFNTKERKNHWQTIVSPMDTEDNGVKINQQAWLKIVDLDENAKIDYKLSHQRNGVYFFLISGEAKIAKEELKNRDAIGVMNTLEISLKAQLTSQILAIEVPLSEN